VTIDSIRKKRLVNVLSALCVLALFVAGGVWWLVRANQDKHYTALFGSGVGVYSGSDVRVLGLKVGSITDVQPQGAVVKVEMDVERGVRVPAGARAVVVAPSLVADRYVQLTPVYAEGPELATGAVIPRERTATPVELDALFRSINDLTTALGPKGANKDGSLAKALDVGADVLRGNGEELNNTIGELGKLTSTLSGNSGDLFATVDNLRTFIATLSKSDAQVRGLSEKLADISGFLAGEKDDLGAALAELATALRQIQGFVADNRGAIKSNVDKLAGVTKALADQRGAIAEILDVAPAALNNLINGYDAASGTLQIRANLNELSTPPLVTVCNLARQGTPKQLPQVLADACDRLAPVLNGVVPLPSAAEVVAGLQNGKLPQLPLPLVRGAGGAR
jgi:virulence factor Mce-like protein